MADVGPHLLGRRPTTPDERDFRAANFVGIGAEVDTTEDPATLIAAGVAELKLTTITYRRWAATTYLHPEQAHWWKAFDYFARAQALIHPPAPPPTGDVIWVDPDAVLDQGNTPHCFPPGTLVTMADGTLQPIESVRVCDVVLSAEGNPREVVGTKMRSYRGEMVTLRLRGHIGISCTTEHPILTARGYIPAGNVSLGDEVCLTRRQMHSFEELRVADVVDEREYANRSGLTRTSRAGGVVTIITAPPKTISLTPAFGRLLGLYAAEGYGGNGKYGIKFAFGKHEGGLVEETVGLIRDVLGAEARVQHRPNNVTCVVLGGKHWNLLFTRLLGAGAAKKEISRWLDGPDDFKRGLLEGWLDGDGHRRRTERSGVTVSERLARQMFALANDLGLRPTLRSDEARGDRVVRTRKRRWTVTFGTGGGVGQSRQDDRAVWRKVREIARTDYYGRVFNLEVEVDNSYVAAGVGVHNCGGFGGAQWGNTDPVEDHYGNADGHALYYEAVAIGGYPKSEDGVQSRWVAQALLARKRLQTYAFASSVAEVRAWIQTKGPVMVGTDWTMAMFSPDADGFVSPSDGDVAGGHFYVLVGDLSAQNAFLCLNSWGAGWGQDGRFKITHSDFQTLLDGISWAGDAIVSVELPL